MCHATVTANYLRLSSNSVVENMRLLDRMKEEYSNVQIPLPVLE